MEEKIQQIIDCIESAIATASSPELFLDRDEVISQAISDMREIRGMLEDLEDYEKAHQDLS